MTPIAKKALSVLAGLAIGAGGSTGYFLTTGGEDAPGPLTPLETARAFFEAAAAYNFGEACALSRYGVGQGCEHSLAFFVALGGELGGVTVPDQSATYVGGRPVVTAKWHGSTITATLSKNDDGDWVVHSTG